MQPVIINAGDLRHRVEIQDATLQPQTSGERKRVWSTWYKCWAEIRPIMGREIELAKSFKATVNHRLTIRYKEGVLPTHGVAFRSRFFSINGVIDPDGRRRWLYLYCTEVIQTAPAT